MLKYLTHFIPCMYQDWENMEIMNLIYHLKKYRESFAHAILLLGTVKHQIIAHLK